MNYQELRRIVLLTYPELIICDTGFGEDKPKTYATMSWLGESSYNSKSQQYHGCYVTGTNKGTGEVFHIITVGLFGGCTRARILTLLHEVGHYDSYQGGDTLSKEYYAWRRCKELYVKFNIPWGKFENLLASKFFSSYVFHLQGVLQSAGKYLDLLGFGLDPLGDDKTLDLLHTYKYSFIPEQSYQIDYTYEYSFWKEKLPCNLFKEKK